MTDPGEAELQERATRRMLLFMSVDMENSTRLKQSPSSGQNHWLTVIENFIEEFPKLFNAHRGRLQREHTLAELPEPKLWKVLGDELVFLSEVSTGEHLTCLMEAFRGTLEESNAKTRDHAKSPPSAESLRLPVKGTAWVAGFPVTNAAILTDRGSDYVGPAMDLGFRLSKLATPQRLALSVDLAWLLTCFDSRLRFHFEGRLDLRGVSEGVGYPFIWAEVSPSLYQDKEDALLGRASSPASLHELCTHFILEHGVPGYLPFLKHEPLATRPPLGYEKDYAQVVEALRKKLFHEPADSPAPAANIAGWQYDTLKALEQQLKGGQSY